MLARTSLAQTPGYEPSLPAVYCCNILRRYEVHLREELDSIKAQLLAVAAVGQSAPVAPNIW